VIVNWTYYQTDWGQFTPGLSVASEIQKRNGRSRSDVDHEPLAIGEHAAQACGRHHIEPEAKSRWGVPWEVWQCGGDVRVYTQLQGVLCTVGYK